MVFPVGADQNLGEATTTTVPGGGTQVGQTPTGAPVFGMTQAEIDAIVGSQKADAAHSWATDSDYLSQAGERNPYDFPLRVSNIDPNVPSYLNQDQNYSGRFSDLVDEGFLGIKDPHITELVKKAAKGKPGEYANVYDWALKRAAAVQKTGKMLTVEDVLNGIIGGKYAEDGPGATDQYGTKNYSTTTSTKNLSNRGEANRIVDAALTQALGRRATQAEQAQFLRVLNQQQSANPNVSTSNTTQTTTKGGSTTSTSGTQSGGFDAQDFGDRYARAQDGYAEYQAATTYMDAFSQTLAKKVNERLV